MKQYSIQLRHDLYFKLLALLNLLWNENFQESVELSEENRKHLEHVQEIIAELVGGTVFEAEKQQGVAKNDQVVAET